MPMAGMVAGAVVMVVAGAVVMVVVGAVVMVVAGATVVMARSVWQLLWSVVWLVAWWPSNRRCMRRRRQLMSILQHHRLMLTLCNRLMRIRHLGDIITVATTTKGQLE